jgi:hypothetical protein
MASASASRPWKELRTRMKGSEMRWRETIGNDNGVRIHSALGRTPSTRKPVDFFAGKSAR